MLFYHMMNAKYLFHVMLNDQPPQLAFTSRILDDLKNTISQVRQGKITLVCQSSTCDPSGYLQFLSHENLEVPVFLLPHGWGASPSQVYPPALLSPTPIYASGWREAL